MKLSELAHDAKSWPFKEAKLLLDRLQKKPCSDNKTVIFETGYGPSGLPHIGTFGEVARTSMVQSAFKILTEEEYNTRLICFSDDMDGFRKVPDNIPNHEMLKRHIDIPLSSVPDPFDKGFESFADHNNSMLCKFLDMFGFDYEFMSATNQYKSGRMDEKLLTMLHHYDDIMEIILPTIGAERRKSYSPFLPISPHSGKVLQVPMINRDNKNGTVVYIDPDTNKEIETKVTGGNVKCQWKADWALRWAALGVDYEMSGKDLIESVKLSSRICRVLGKEPPTGFNYELFLDERGEKISKSKGNGISIDEWLDYASPESLSFYMFQKPKTAKKLHLEIIPKAVDDYITFLEKFQKQELNEQIDNPTWHIHNGRPPEVDLPVSFSLLLNLVAASNADDRLVLWGFIERLSPELTPDNHPLLDKLVQYAIRYFEKNIKPNKIFRSPDSKERIALTKLDEALADVSGNMNADDLQKIVFDIGKKYGYENNLRDWFMALYEVLLGQSKGPRFGSFVELYGISETRVLIAKSLSCVR